MNRVMFLFIVVLSMLIITIANNGMASLGIANSLPGISGRFYVEKDNSPLPGALIAIYNSDNNYFVDHTYTQDTGCFYFKSPSLKGEFYIIASKEKHCVRSKNFLNESASSATNIMLPSLRWKPGWHETFYSQLGTIVVFILGVVLSEIQQWRRRIAIRKKAKKNLVEYLSGMAHTIPGVLTDYQALQSIKETFVHTRTDENMEIKQQYIDTVKSILGKAEILCAVKDDIYNEFREAGQKKLIQEYKSIRTAATVIIKHMEKQVTGPILIDDTWSDLNSQVDTIKKKWRTIAYCVNDNKLRTLFEK